MNYCTSHDAVVAEDHSNSTIPKVVDNDDGDDAKNVAIAENNPKMVVAETDSIRKKIL